MVTAQEYALRSRYVCKTNVDATQPLVPAGWSVVDAQSALAD